jgi:hypothetical protein
MSKSSIHFENVKPTSQSHNLRLREFEYVRKDLTPLNSSFLDKIPHSEIIQELKTIVKEKTGRTAQAKAKFILEGVFLFDERHTDEDIKRVASAFNRKFNVKPIGLHIHRDEGHYDHKGKWKANLHTHILFENIDRNTGKSHRWNKEDLSNIQTFFSEALNMERGKSSNKKHLNSIEFKLNEKKQELNSIEFDLKLFKEELDKKEQELLEDLKNTLKYQLKQNTDSLEGIEQLMYIMYNEEYRKYFSNKISDNLNTAFIENFKKQPNFKIYIDLQNKKKTININSEKIKKVIKTTPAEIKKEQPKFKRKL